MEEDGDEDIVAGSVAATPSDMVNEHDPVPDCVVVTVLLFDVVADGDADTVAVTVVVTLLNVDHDDGDNVTDGNVDPLSLSDGVDNGDVETAVVLADDDDDVDVVTEVD